MDGRAKAHVFWISWLLWSFPCCSRAEVVVDAQIIETEWEQSQTYTAFRTTEPLTLDAPPHATSVRVLATAQGLAIGVECEQPEALRVRGRSPRDALMLGADTVSVVVDFQGTGSTAYEFTVSLSGSVRDGTVLQQNRFQYSWDGVWHSAVRETERGWDVEMLLPWSTASIGEIDRGQRTIGLFVTRELRSRSQRFSYPAISLQSPSFVADFQKMRIPAFYAPQTAFIPYLAISRDLLRRQTDSRGGADIVWSPTADQQLLVTLKPDFGQIENDDLLVNFTALQTLLPDNRSFFNQSQQLFDLRILQADRLINTRRVGAAPDAGPRSNTEVLGAAKYVWTKSGWELGAFAAVEDDSTIAQGRTFAAARSRWKGRKWSLGYLGTITERPTLTRDVWVHSTDAEWSPVAGWRLSGQIATTRPSQDLETGLPTEAGYGMLAKFEYAGTAPLTETLNLTWYDQRYYTNDMGFMERNSLREVRSETYWYYRREYPAGSPLLETQWYINARARMNDRSELLPSSFQVGPYWKYRNGSSLFVYVQPTSAGIDDLSLRGNGSFWLPPQHEAGVSFLSDPSGVFQCLYHLRAFREGLEDYGWEAQVRPSLLPSEHLRFGLAVIYRRSPDWLIWRPDAERMIQHERRLLQTSLGAEWFPSVRSELRVKLQWVGLRAHSIASYDIDDSQQLVRSGLQTSDFSRSEFALQVRFRYQIRPLSDLYVAYSLGGFAEEKDQGTFDHLWRAAVSERNAHQLMIKLAYAL